MNRPENCPSVTVLICTLNEEESLPHVLPKIPDWVDEVLLVDGNSTDATVEVAKKLYPKIRVLYQSGKGKGDALKCGIQEATGDIIVTLDADSATDPADLHKFVTPLLEGFDFVKGSRFVHGAPRNKLWYRILGNRIITWTFNIVFGVRYTDICSGYNAFWKAKLTKVMQSWPSDGYENEPLINSRVCKGKLKVAEVAHNDNARLSGEVKERSLRQGFKAIKTILRERFRN